MFLWVVWIADLQRGIVPSSPRAAKARKLVIQSTRVNSRKNSSRAPPHKGRAFSRRR